VQDYRNLKVWGRAHQLTLAVYRVTSRFPKDELYGLTSQIRRACASIPANIAEGCGRNSDAELARLLFTSPPYFGLTNYHYDQWLRLWLLGGPPNALRVGGSHRGKFEHRERYRNLLLKVFGNAAKLLSSDSVVYVRTGRQKITYKTTLEVLGQVFPEKRLFRKAQPFLRPTQTRLFGDHSAKVGEVDLILLPR